MGTLILVVIGTVIGIFIAMALMLYLFSIPSVAQWYMKWTIKQSSKMTDIVLESFRESEEEDE